MFGLEVLAARFQSFVPHLDFPAMVSVGSARRWVAAWSHSWWKIHEQEVASTHREQHRGTICEDLLYAFSGIDLEAAIINAHEYD